jgi:hypothetical protein
MAVSGDHTYEPFLAKISSTFSQRLDEIRDDPLASAADKKNAEKLISIIQHTHDRIAYTKIQELATLFKNPTSAIDRRYSSLLEGEYEKYKNSEQQLQRLFKNLTTAINLQATAWTQTETDPAGQSARQAAQNAINEYNTFRSRLAADSPRDSEFYGEFVLLQTKNNPLVEKMEQSVLNLPAILESAFTKNAQPDCHSFHLLTMEIQGDLRHTIDILSQEMELLREARMTSNEPIKEHLAFLQDIINAASTNNGNFSPQQRMQVLQQEEPAFAEAYSCVALAFLNPLFPRQDVATLAKGLQDTMRTKAEIAVTKIENCFLEIKNVTPGAIRKALVKATRCRNPLCPHQQEQKAVFNSDTLPVVLQKCTRCMKARYCSQECQKADWPMHKLTCKLPLKKS